MAVEIERKFLVLDDDWRVGAIGTVIRQGYLALSKERSVRVRIAGPAAYLTIKGPTIDATRLEYEYPIPLIDADNLLNEICVHPLIEKTRYKITFYNLVWEVDVFKGDNSGLIVAEVELENINQQFKRPSWIGSEVTGDAKYYNTNLIHTPYNHW